jgi:glyoxylase-like metal-dependent hydrolase (beta-lactamase superfamily II)
MRIVDVRHLGREQVIGCWVVDGVLVDPGPASTIDTLLEELGDEEPRAILLTHIHFDHAGGTGALLRRWPDLDVYVHERGAKHLADPARLVASATRIYGEEGMKRLWGEVIPVPETNLRALSGGETVLGAFRVEYTPGHAVHHVSYLHEETGAAFVGDVAGVRIPPADLVIAPTPPPDIDLPAWERSLDLLGEWSPSMLALTHFGRVDDVERHLDSMRGALRDEAALARQLDLEAFTGCMRDRLTERSDAATVDAYAQAAPLDHLWYGLRRFWDNAEAR